MGASSSRAGHFKRKEDAGCWSPSCTKVRLPAAQHCPMLNCSAMNAASAACGRQTNTLQHEPAFSGCLAVKAGLAGMPLGVEHQPHDYFTTVILPDQGNQQRRFGDVEAR